MMTSRDIRVGLLMEMVEDAIAETDADPAMVREALNTILEDYEEDEE
jgi:hypothetical protein